MELSKDLKKLLVAGAALLMTASVMGTGNVANAKHRRYRYRTHRVYRRHARTHHTYRKHSRRALRRYKHKRNTHKFNVYEHNFHKTFDKMVNKSKWSQVSKMNKQAFYGGYNKEHNKAYHQGYLDGYSDVTNPAGTDSFAFDKKYKKNKNYKQGFIYAMQFSNPYNPNPYKVDLAIFNYYTNHKSRGPVKHLDKSMFDGVGPTIDFKDNMPFSEHDGSLEDTGQISHHHKFHRSRNYKHSNQNDQNNSVATNLSEMKQETIKDINQDRENNGIYPLQVSPELNQIANMRAQQELTHYGHIDPNTGYGYANEDGYKLGYNSSPSNQKYGGNLGESFLKETIDNGNGTTSYFKNGKEMADGIENGMMTNDAASNWGHRDNILGHSSNLAYHYLGVGVSHLPNSNKYYVAEDLE